MLKVYHRQGDNIEVTMRKLRKLCEKAGVIKEMKKHEYYEKPSIKKARQLRQAKKKAAELNDERNKAMGY